MIRKIRKNQKNFFKVFTSDYIETACPAVRRKKVRPTLEYKEAIFGKTSFYLPHLPPGISYGTDFKKINPEGIEKMRKKKNRFLYYTIIFKALQVPGGKKKSEESVNSLDLPKKTCYTDVAEVENRIKKEA